MQTDPISVSILDTVAAYCDPHDDLYDEPQHEEVERVYDHFGFDVGTYDWYTKGDCFGRAEKLPDGTVVLEGVEGEDMGDSPGAFAHQVEYFVVLIDPDGGMRASSAERFPTSHEFLWAVARDQLGPIRERLIHEARTDPEWTDESEFDEE
jgi:hypothetical protein